MVSSDDDVSSDDYDTDYDYDYDDLESDDGEPAENEAWAAALDAARALGLKIYFNQSAPAAARVDTAELEALFDKYKAVHEPTKILAEGVGQLCEDLEVDPSDVSVLVMAYEMGAQRMCEFTRDEFVTGLASMGVDSLDALKGRLPTMRDSLASKDVFREVYLFAFGFSLDEPGQRVLQCEVAVAMWRLLFARHSWVHTGAWCDFVETTYKRAVTRDAWMQLLDFVEKIEPDCSNYDAMGGAWHSLLDEFVEHLGAADN